MPLNLAAGFPEVQGCVTFDLLHARSVEIQESDSSRDQTKTPNAAPQPGTFLLKSELNPIGRFVTSL